MLDIRDHLEEEGDMGISIYFKFIETFLGSSNIVGALPHQVFSIADLIDADGQVHDEELNIVPKNFICDLKTDGVYSGKTFIGMALFGTYKGTKVVLECCASPYYIYVAKE
jgi:hypothetical protein